jgi:hypothetical protein
MTQIDQHDHSTGKGTPVTPSGLNINQDLPFNDNNATELRSTNYEVQVSPLAGASDIGCLYVSGVDLYYNDENGNQIRITQSGSIAGSPGSISGLTPPASVSYSPITFTFQSTTATAANIDAGSFTFRDTVANAKGITVQSPVGLANNYSLVWPSALPSTAIGSKFLTIDGTGNIADSIGPDNITTIFSSSGLSLSQQSVGVNYLAPQQLTTASTIGQVTYKDSSGVVSTSIIPNFTNLINITLSVSGNRPIYVGLVASTGGAGYISNDSPTNSASLRFYRNSNQILSSTFSQVGDIPCSSLFTYDFAPSSTYTYSIAGAVASSAGGNGIEIVGFKFLAFEM